MQTYIVLYRDYDANLGEEPLGFRCQADDEPHAAEQCENAYPCAEIVWVHKGASLRSALSAYEGGL